MKLFSHIAMFAAGMLALASCSDKSIGDIDVDDPFVQPGDRAATIEVPLRFHVEKPSLIGKPLVNDIPSRAEGEGDDPTDDPEKAAEEAINDIWVFQYDENGNQLIAPRFYKVESSEIRKLNIRLAEGNNSHVYVLANTGDETWAQDKDFTTLEKFVSYEYPFTEDNVEMGKDERLLMEGHVESTIRKETDLHPIDIHLTRMMAKISFKYVTAAAAASLVVNRVIINNMPMNMRMEETPKEENYPTGEDFETRSVTLDNNFSSGKVYTFYMPANRRGSSSNTDPKLKNNGAPDKALYVQLFVSSKSNGSNYLYTIYLG
ncbi:fimbrial protein, partial [uncultured Muribaculum sp.]|uniref:fimbrial protein n=1 Tax=uncultured Muribaculum sp. TaxID=1918613 RepID=UPI002711EC68